MEFIYLENGKQLLPSKQNYDEKIHESKEEYFDNEIKKFEDVNHWQERYNLAYIRVTKIGIGTKKINIESFVLVEHL